MFKKLTFLGLCTLTVGCNLDTAFKKSTVIEPCQFSTYHDQKKSLKDFRVEARRIVADLRCQTPRSDHYWDGYIDGFVDCLDYGRPGNPVLPHRSYWGRAFRTAEGRAAMQEWFAGFRDGTAMAETYLPDLWMPVNHTAHLPQPICFPAPMDEHLPFHEFGTPVGPITPPVEEDFLPPPSFDETFPVEPQSFVPSETNAENADAQVIDAPETTVAHWELEPLSEGMREQSFSVTRSVEPWDDFESLGGTTLDSTESPAAPVDVVTESETVLELNFDSASVIPGPPTSTSVSLLPENAWQPLNSEEAYVSKDQASLSKEESPDQNARDAFDNQPVIELKFEAPRLTETSTPNRSSAAALLGDSAWKSLETGEPVSPGSDAKDSRVERVPHHSTDPESLEQFRMMSFVDEVPQPEMTPLDEKQQQKVSHPLSLLDRSIEQNRKPKRQPSTGGTDDEDSHRFRFGRKPQDQSPSQSLWKRIDGPSKDALADQDSSAQSTGTTLPATDADPLWDLSDTSSND